MTINYDARRYADGTLSVELLQAAPQERWAVVRWQSGPMMYRVLERYDSQADADTGLCERIEQQSFAFSSTDQEMMA